MSTPFGRIELEPVRRTVRIPGGTTVIQVKPGFGGEVIITCTGSDAKTLGLPIIAPAGFTYSPDGTVTYPDPFADSVTED